jgi:alanine or glycine:cation symporter, AGCS family
MLQFWEKADEIVWAPMAVILLSAGIYLSLRFRFVHIRNFRFAWRLAAGGKESASDPSSAGVISPWQSMMTMLAGAIGNGNIAGVSTAIATGGPGAIFWMWLSGMFSMATKYSEAILGLKFREKQPDGSVAGGPMYYLRTGVKSPVLAWVFALIAGMAAMTTGPLAQTNSMALVLNTEFHIPKWVSGAAITVGTWLVVIGGIRSIARFAEKLVPLKIILYVGGAAYVLLWNLPRLPETIGLIFTHAFTPTAAVGGFLGAGVVQAARLGAARGLYANEAGMGTAAMAYGAAKSREPVQQGLIAMIDVFVITFVTCTMTALVVTVTGQWSSGLMSTELVAAAFNTRIPVVGGWLVALSSFLFGYSNLVGWSYYGELCFQYILSKKILKLYAWIYCGLIFVGAVSQVKTVWAYADTMNGLQVFPNLFGVILLAPQVAAISAAYFNRRRESGRGV